MGFAAAVWYDEDMKGRDAEMAAGWTEAALAADLRALGVAAGMGLEVHTALGQVGHVDGGAGTMVAALMAAVGPEGTLVMPSLRLSGPVAMDDADRAMGLTMKLRILPEDAPVTGMGAVADAFRARADVVTGAGVFRASAWGKDAAACAREGFGRLVETGGYGLLVGVDIYRLTAMHSAEGDLPQAVRDIFTPPEAALRRYPAEEWLVEAGAPPVKAWHVIWARAEALGYVRRGRVGAAESALFRLADVVGLYREALRTDALGLYGLRGGGGGC